MRPDPRLPDPSAVFGRWVAELLADAWRNGWRPADAAQEAEGRVVGASAATTRPHQAGERRRGGNHTGDPTGILRH